MRATRTYNPPPPKIPAGDVFCANPRVLQDPDPRPHTYGVRVCSCAAFATDPCRPTACTTPSPYPSTDPCSLPGYRYVSPDGDGRSHGISATHSVAHPPSDHPSLITAHSSHTFSAKERDSETGLSYFGSRYYSSDLSIWLSVDPMSDKYPSFSPYTYCANNPVKLVDPNGEEVEITYNKTTNTLYVIDKDIYRQDLPKIYVSAENYKMGGIRNDKGELTCNQVLVIDNVFSGGEVSDEGKIVRDSEKSYEKAIPNGSYDIVDNKASTDHPEWFRLEKRDSSPYNDTDDNSGRDGFRLHLGTISYGCVTIDQNKKESKKSWNVLTNILNKTSTTTVKERRGRQWLNPFSRLTRYGTLRVIGTDNLPSK